MTKRICIYCRQPFGESIELAPGLPPGAVSHGICVKCSPIADKDLDRALKKLAEDKTKITRPRRPCA